MDIPRVNRHVSKVPTLDVAWEDFAFFRAFECQQQSIANDETVKKKISCIECHEILTPQSHESFRLFARFCPDEGVNVVAGAIESTS